MSSTTPQASPTTAARRGFLSGFGKFTLSATAIALLAGRDRLALIGSAEREDCRQRRDDPQRRPGG